MTIKIMNCKRCGHEWQAKNRTKLRFAQSVKVRISTRIGRKAGYNGECRIYSFAFNGGIIRLCAFVHHDPGALDLLHDGWEGTMITAGEERQARHGWAR